MGSNQLVQLGDDMADVVVLGREDCGDAGRTERFVVLGRDDASDDDGCIDTLGPDRLNGLGDEVPMTARKDAEPDRIDVFVAGGDGDLGPA